MTTTTPYYQAKFDIPFQAVTSTFPQSPPVNHPHFFFLTNEEDTEKTQKILLNLLPDGDIAVAVSGLEIYNIVAKLNLSIIQSGHLDRKIKYIIIIDNSESVGIFHRNFIPVLSAAKRPEQAVAYLCTDIAKNRKTYWPEDREAGPYYLTKLDKSIRSGDSFLSNMELYTQIHLIAQSNRIAYICADLFDDPRRFDTLWSVCKAHGKKIGISMISNVHEFAQDPLAKQNFSTFVCKMINPGTLIIYSQTDDEETVHQKAIQRKLTGNPPPPIQQMLGWIPPPSAWGKSTKIARK
jgi:hypothetical protein